MFYKDFTFHFKEQVCSLSFFEGLNLALTICKRLYFDYENFVLVENWGYKDVLIDAILLCEQAKVQAIDATQITEMLLKVDAITPDTEDFGSYYGSYALNVATSVYETLEFILDKDPLHVYNIGTYFTDTVDFKIREKEDLIEKQIDEHPMMVEARKWLLNRQK